MAESSKDDLHRSIASLRKSKLALLDGGLATHLEDAFGQDLSSSPLWSAFLLDSEEGCKAILQTHLDFLRAGADIISTSSYQVSRLAYQLAEQSPTKADEVLKKSVELAYEAIQQFIASDQSHRNEPPLLLLSLGPYGAALANGSEYTGDYKIDSEEKQVDITIQHLEDFHFDRLQAIANDVRIWEKVDLIGFETIPRLDEALAIRKALLRMFLSCTRKTSYISFVFPSGNGLPWPIMTEGEESILMRQMKRAVLEPDEDGTQSPLSGIGINCTKPRYLPPLVKEMTSAMTHHTNSLRKDRKYLFLYPDGGLVWDGLNRLWMQDGECNQDPANEWCDTLFEAVKEARLDEGGPWDGCILGGCCKATTKNIAALRVGIDARTCEKGQGGTVQ